jgi:lysophospholipase L1-like esterase
MRVYFALGDSIAIDDYTGVRGGRAASQLARRLGVDLVDLTRDGNTAHGALADLARAPAAADVVTLTASGNDLPECSTTPAPSSSPPSSASNGLSSAGSGKPRSRSPARASSTTSSTVNEFFTRLAEQARAEGGTFETWCGERRVRAALAGSSRLGR